MNKLFLGFIAFVALLSGGIVHFAHECARAQESFIMTHQEILANYRNFQYIAQEKGIARMPNDRAKKVPEIQKILEDRDALLAKIARGCTLTYKAGSGITSANFEPIKVRCDPSSFWRWQAIFAYKQ